MLKDAREFLQILIKLTEHLISSSANRSQRSAPKCKGFHNLHGLLPVGIYVRVCVGVCTNERERDRGRERERERPRRRVLTWQPSLERLCSERGSRLWLLLVGGDCFSSASGLIKTHVDHPESFCSD